MDCLAKKVGIDLAKSICPGCVYLECRVSEKMIHSKKKPCPMFNVENFYYDSNRNRFWCKNWVGENAAMQETIYSN